MLKFQKFRGTLNPIGLGIGEETDFITSLRNTNNLSCIRVVELKSTSWMALGINLVW